MAAFTGYNSLAAARREGVIEGLTWARHRASTVYDVERIQAEIDRLRAEQKEG